MSFPLDLRAFGCTALLPSAATPYGCIFRTTARHERAPVRVLTRSVSDVGRSPVPIPLVHPAAAGASDPARSGPPLLANCRVRLWKTLPLQDCSDLSVRWSHRGAAARSDSVSRSRQHLSHRVRGGSHTASLPGSVPGRPPAPPGGSCTPGRATASPRRPPPGLSLVDASEEELSREA